VLHCAPSATQDARDFGSDGYSLRVQHKFSRHIKLLICVTLYNEDQETLGKTLLGICEVCHSAASACATEHAGLLHVVG
jgi:chitin synthase